MELLAICFDSADELSAKSGDYLMASHTSASFQLIRFRVTIKSDTDISQLNNSKNEHQL
jgi:hypothetical protein